MPKLFVQNLSSKTTTIGIEPWADVATLEPNERAEFEYTEPAEVGFALLDDGSATVDLVSDQIAVTVKGVRRKIV
jgi:hypothetical protein